ncbi:MAG: hypothetical protein J0H40_16990 [Rhizobiales bacterium]|nr:hypothetical protein [Hyphomicrobiales bacterium]
MSETVGDLDMVVRSVAAPENATSGSLIFMQACSAMITPGVVVVTTDPLKTVGGCCIVTIDPRRWFARALESLFPPDAPTISEHAVIAKTARIATGVSVGPFCVIGEYASIGEGTRIGSHVTIHDSCRIGSGCVVQDHTVIGSSGVAYYRDAGEEWFGLPHLGIADLGDNVEVGAHCVVVRGILNDTIIESGTKIGNFVNIGHNAVIGKKCWITSGAVICGRVIMGENVLVAANASVRDKIAVGARSRIGLGAVVTKDLPADSKIFGNPGRPLRTMGSF